MDRGVWWAAVRGVTKSQDMTEWTEHTHTKLIHNIISVSGVHHSTSVSIHISK